MNIETKVCKSCQQEKEIAAFYPRMARCKICHGVRTRQWALHNPEKVKASHDKWRSKPGSREKENLAAKRWQREHPQEYKLNRFKYNLKQYGLTIEQHQEMVEVQHGCCAICGDQPTRSLDVDHNHTTGMVRKLLCSNCNTTIGLVNESVELLQQIIDYLQSHQQAAMV